MGKNLPAKRAPSFGVTSDQKRIKQHRRGFDSSPMQAQLNPSTFRPPGSTKQHPSQTGRRNTGTNPDLRDMEPGTASQAMHGIGVMVVGGTTEESNRGRPQSGNKWRRMLADNTRQFERILQVLLISTLGKFFCQAGVCRDVEHTLVSYSTARTLGTQIYRLPAAATWWFVTPWWGRIQVQFFTRLVVGLLEGNREIEMGNVVVLPDEFFSGFDVGIILGRAFSEAHLDRNPRQPTLVRLDQLQAWFQNAATSSASDNNLGVDFLTPMTAGPYPVNYGNQLYNPNAGFVPSAQSPMYPTGYQFQGMAAAPFQVTPPQSAIRQGLSQDAFSPFSPNLEFSQLPASAGSMQGGLGELAMDHGHLHR